MVNSLAPNVDPYVGATDIGTGAFTAGFIFEGGNACWMFIVPALHIWVKYRAWREFSIATLAGLSPIRVGECNQFPPHVFASLPKPRGPFAPPSVQLPVSSLSLASSPPELWALHHPQLGSFRQVVQLA